MNKQKELLEKASRLLAAEMVRGGRNMLEFWWRLLQIFVVIPLISLVASVFFFAYLMFELSRNCLNGKPFYAMLDQYLPLSDR